MQHCHQRSKARLPRALIKWIGLRQMSRSTTQLVMLSGHTWCLHLSKRTRISWVENNLKSILKTDHLTKYLRIPISKIKVRRRYNTNMIISISKKIKSRLNDRTSRIRGTSKCRRIMQSKKTSK